jgi:RNA polymerase sigma factor (sigma-70 family)
MANKPLSDCFQHICRLAVVQTARELGDHELLKRFVADKDEAAFAVLVERHGPRVLGVCRRMLGSAHDAEDACQAAFLVLAQKAASIRKTTSLASWLHGVAARVAGRVRRQHLRRARRERASQGADVTDPAALVSWREVQTILDEELEHLPERLRAPLILCYLDGRPRDDAARQLGLSVACLHGRLERGRKALCEALTRRGVTLSATLLAAAVGEGVSRAALPPTTVLHTARAAVLFGSGGALAVGLVSTKILSLAQEVTRNMLMTHLKLGVAAMLCAGLLVAALAGSLAAGGADEQAKKAPPSDRPQPAADKSPKSPPPAQPQSPKRPVEEERVSGRVLDPEGKPVAGAKVHLLQWGPPWGPPLDKSPKVWAETDKDGRFSFTAPRYYGELFVTAVGFAPGWDKGGLHSVVRVGEPEQPAGYNGLVRLARDDVPVNGRLLDLQGQPVAGATVRVFTLYTPPDGSLDKWIAAVKNRRLGDRVEQQQYLSAYSIDGMTHFFPPITTDKDGRFQIKGIGRERVAAFTVEGPTIETRVVHVVTRPGLGVDELRDAEDGLFFGDGSVKELRLRAFYPPTFTHTADPCRVVTGVVRDKATGKPIAGAVVRGDQPVRYPVVYNQTTTDKEGRYRLTGLPLTARFGASASVVALAPDGEPYPAVIKGLPGDKGTEVATLDLDLVRGVWLEGQVKNKATGRGVPAQLRYFAFTEWKFDNRMILPVGDGGRSFRDPFKQLTTDKEGKFRILAPADRGLLAASATGEESNHYRTGVGADKIKGEEAKEKGGVLFVPTLPQGGTAADAFDTLVEVNPEKGATSVRCDVELDPGRTVTVQVRGPDGKPLEGVRAHGQSGRDFSLDGSANPFASAYLNLWSQNPLASEFTVYALEPGKTRTLLLEHPQKNLTGRCEILGDKDGPVVVTLGPAAAAAGRLVDDNGRPLAGADLLVQFRLAKGGWAYHHSREVRTDAAGKFRLDGLVPGTSYHAFVRLRRVYVTLVFDDLSLKSGEEKDLGDIKVKKPGSE